MVQILKSLIGRIEIRLAISIFLMGLIGTFVYASVQFSKATDEPEFPIVNTWQELIEEYIAFRDSSYPLIPPDGVLSDLPSLDGVSVETLQADSDWYWTFEQNIYLFEESSELAKQIPHDTVLVIYEDMAADELLVYSAPEKEGEDYKEEIVFRAPPWPEPGLFERSSRYLYRELTKRRMVWKVTLKSRKAYEKEALAASKLSASLMSLDESGIGMMLMMYTGAVEEVTIVNMKKATNGLLLEIGYPSEYTGTSWSVYSYDAPACVYTNNSGAGGGTPTPPGGDETNICEDCFSCYTDPERTFLGLERVWTLTFTNLILTGDTRTVWADTRPLGLDSSNEPCHRFYGLGNNEVDADSDGLSDAVERFVHKTDPSDNDTDNDEMPDGWEVLRGLNPLFQDAFGDSDGDGFANLEEHRADTDPTNALSAPANTFYVDAQALPGGDGSFTNPFKRIRQGLDAVTNGGRVCLKSGTYSGYDNYNLDYAGKDVWIKGINGAEATLIDCRGKGRGFIWRSGETSNAVLEGVTVKNGFVEMTMGGGLYVSNGSPRITSCILWANHAQKGGGIGVCGRGSVRMVNCVIRDNRATEEGGGVYAEGFSDAHIEHCTIMANTAENAGGGISALVDSRVMLAGSIAWSNSPTSLDLPSTGPELLADPDLSHQVNLYGSPWMGGGDEYTYGSGMYYIHEGGFLNLATRAVYEPGYIPQLEVVSGKMYRIVVDGQGWIKNSVTISAASQSFSSNGFSIGILNWEFTAGVHSTGLGVQVISQPHYQYPDPIIHWGLFNLYGVSIKEIKGSDRSNLVAYCCVDGGFTGEAITTNNPLFTSDGFHLCADSPCRNVSTNRLFVDVDNEDRASTCDLGADEFCDTDGDGIADDWEWACFSNLTQAGSSTDGDDDGLTDREEYELNTDPNLGDGDNDGISDEDEIEYGTDPRNPDSDGDGAVDGDEIEAETNPNNDPGDSDGDGLSDDTETVMGSNAEDPDSDGDGMPDGFDPYPTQANCFVERTKTVELPSVPEELVGDGTENPEYFTTLDIDPQLPANATSVKTVRVYGYVDDAIAINGNHAVWELGRWTTEPFDVDATQWITDRRRGTFEIDVYDYIFEGWISNHVFFSGSADITYLEALSYDMTLAGESNMCVGGSIQMTAGGGVLPYTWLSDNTTVATVDNQGLVSGLSPGFVLISVVDSNGCQKDKAVNVLKMELKSDGTEVDDDGYVYISDTPEMPDLRARLKPDGLPGQVSWRLFVEYKRNRTDEDYYPASAWKTLNASDEWDITSDMGTDLRGGKAKLYYNYQGAVCMKTFHIRSDNPSVNAIETEIGTSPWFARPIAEWESDYFQFNTAGTLGPNPEDYKFCPNFGAPNGWGIYQLDTPSPSAQQLWKWTANVSEGKARLADPCRTEAESWMVSQENQQQAEEPSMGITNYVFTFNGVDFQKGTARTPVDACTIQRYNGSVLWVIYWQNTTTNQPGSWQIRDTHRAYVDNVCGEVN